MWEMMIDPLHSTLGVALVGWFSFRLGQLVSENRQLRDMQEDF